MAARREAPGPGDDPERRRLAARLAAYWDRDAATYDRARAHVAASPAEQAAWRAALCRHLPSPPARVLDVGAGTGFLSLTLAELGHQVTALDLSAEMLARLTAKAASKGLEVATRLGDACEPPEGPFDAVVERHLLWTLADPVGTLRAWREVAPGGRLVLYEGLWGSADRAEARRARLRQAAHRLRRLPPDHHAAYDAELLSRLPLSSGTHPERVVAAVEAAGWRLCRLERLTDVEWVRLLERPPLERLLGTTPCFAVVAD
jgi:SAM-dependent methyltransferase